MDLLRNCPTDLDKPCFDGETKKFIDWSAKVVKPNVEHIEKNFHIRDPWRHYIRAVSQITWNIKIKLSQKWWPHFQITPQKVKLRQPIQSHRQIRPAGIRGGKQIKVVGIEAKTYHHYTNILKYKGGAE